MTRLTVIRSALLNELKGDGARLSFVNTRLILSIGINLNEITAAMDGDPSIVENTVSTLRKMGFLNHGEASHGR